MSYRKPYNMDKRIIKAKYPTVCADTGNKIARGEECVYDPKTKNYFKLKGENNDRTNL